MNLSKPIVESAKEFVRTFVLGEIPVLIGVLAIIRSGINVEVGNFLIQWTLVTAALVAGTIGSIETALFKGFDKWLHESDVKTVLDLKGMDALRK